MRRSVQICAAAFALLALTGCGLHDPYNSASPPPLTGHRRVSASGSASAPPSSPLPLGAAPTVAGVPARAAGVLRRFALIYGNFSASTVRRQQQALIALATGAYERDLRASEHQAELAATRAMPPGASTTSTIASAQFAPPHGALERGVAILLERLQTASGVRGQPVTDVYLAELLKTRNGWRVARFAPQP